VSAQHPTRRPLRGAGSACVDFAVDVAPVRFTSGRAKNDRSDEVRLGCAGGGQTSGQELPHLFDVASAVEVLRDLEARRMGMATDREAAVGES
jgi:hypothetical protein